MLNNISYLEEPTTGRVKLGYNLPLPLIDLDYSQDLMSNVFDLSIEDFEILKDGQEDPASGSGDVGGAVGGGLRIRLKETGGMPCIVHQSGCKGCQTDRRALENLAKALGVV